MATTHALLYACNFAVHVKDRSFSVSRPHPLCACTYRFASVDTSMVQVLLYACAFEISMLAAFAGLVCACVSYACFWMHMCA